MASLAGLELSSDLTEEFYVRGLQTTGTLAASTSQ